MPYILERHVPHVTHIGFFERPLSEARPGLDGPGISVSNDPGVWRAIKGLNGPEWELSYSAAKWVDALSFTSEDRADIEDWMVMMRYMRKVMIWEVSSFDEEAGDFIDTSFLNLEDAAKHVGRSLTEERAAQAEGQGAAMEAEGYRLEKRAMSRLGGWPDPLLWHDAAILLYTREVIMPKRPLVVGVWWDEAVNTDLGTAPSGVLFPERLPLFDVEDEEGYTQPFTEAFPEFAIPLDEPEAEDVMGTLVRRMQAEEARLIESGMDPVAAARRVMES